MTICSLFVWLISHQTTVFFSQNKPVSSTFLSEQISTGHRPNEEADESFAKQFCFIQLNAWPRSNLVRSL
jgi:hypothetical protein